MSSISKATSSDPTVLALLAKHPKVEQVEQGPVSGLEFFVEGRNRLISVGKPECEDYGILEIIDNNPLVCANEISVPSAGVTGILIALAPLVQAGLLLEAPVVVSNVEIDKIELVAALTRLGFNEEPALHTESLDLEGVVAVTVMAAIPGDLRKPELDVLFDERYGRSFFVRLDQTSEWSRALVKGQPWAVYRFTLAPDDPTSLFTVRILLDVNGKGGASQSVHAMNVMCGFEESLGLA